MGLFKGNFFKKIIGNNTADVIKEGTKLIDEIFTSKEEKIAGKKALFEMTIADKQDARRMYDSDSGLQKAFAIFFLISWVSITILVLNYFVFESIKLEEWQIAFCSTIYGGISTKLNTIVDFLFGSSSSIKIDKRDK